MTTILFAMRYIDKLDYFVRSRERESTEGKRMLTAQEALGFEEFSFPPTHEDRENFFNEIGKYRDLQNWHKVLSYAGYYKRIFPNDPIPGVDSASNIDEEEDSKILLQVTQERFGRAIADTAEINTYNINFLNDVATVYPQYKDEWFTNIPKDYKEKMLTAIKEHVNGFSNGSVFEEAGIFITLFPEYTQEVQEAVTPETWLSMASNSIGLRYGENGDDIDRFVSDATATLRLFPGRKEELRLANLGEKIWKKIGDRHDHHRSNLFYFWLQAADIADLIRLMSGEDSLSFTHSVKTRLSTQQQGVDGVRIGSLQPEITNDKPITDYIIEGLQRGEAEEANRQKMQDIQSYFFAVAAKGALHKTASKVELPPFKKIDSQGRSHRYTETFMYKREFGIGRRTLSQYILDIADVGPNYKQGFPPHLELDMDNHHVRTLRFYWNEGDFESLSIPNLDPDGELGKIMRNVEERRKERKNGWSYGKQPRLDFKCIEIELGDFFKPKPAPGNVHIYSYNKAFRLNRERPPQNMQRVDYRPTQKNELGYGFGEDGPRRYSFKQLQDLVHDFVSMIPTELREFTFTGF